MSILRRLPKFVTARAKPVAGIFLASLVAVSSGFVVEGFQDGPALCLSDSLSVGDYRLGLLETDSANRLLTPGAQASFFGSRCIASSSDAILTDGKSTLQRGFISSKTLVHRLGQPVGTCRVSDALVWIYNYPLKTPLSNGRYLTNKGHLYVFLEERPLGFQLSNFEITIEGSGVERWPEQPT